MATTEMLTDCKEEAGHKRTIHLNDEMDSTFVWCPAGEFMMGDTEDHPTSRIAQPQHKVILTSGFWIGETNMLANQIKAITGEQPPITSTWDHEVEFTKQFTEFGHKHSLIDENWSVHLPTEAQWEYACRAGTTTQWFFGDDPAQLELYIASCHKDEHGQWIAPGVKSTLPNRWGIYDLIGTYAWCLDSSGMYPDETRIDPVNLKDSEYKIIRGSQSWCGMNSKHPDAYRSAHRGHLNIRNIYNDDVCLRILCSPMKFDI